MDIIDGKNTSLTTRIVSSPSQLTLDDLHEKFVVTEGVTEEDFFLAFQAAQILIADGEKGVDTGR